jgi:signal transduction histidine kinase
VGYDLAFEPPSGDVFADVNVLQIERALANIIRNATDYGRNSGTITILIDMAGGIEIRDGGPGIPEEAHENVFQPFYRLKPLSHGAGLGLNLARQIIQLHGGTIEILRGGWLGARFRLQLPIHQAQTL